MSSAIATSTAEMIGLELARSPESPKEFKGKVTPDWCVGCGDFGVLNALQRALFESGSSRMRSCA